MGGILATAVTVPSYMLEGLSENERRAVQYLVLARDINPFEVEFKTKRGSQGSIIYVPDAIPIYVDDHGILHHVPSYVPSVEMFERRSVADTDWREGLRIKDKLLLYGTGEHDVNGAKLLLLDTHVERFDILAAPIIVDGVEGSYRNGDTIEIAGEMFELKRICLRTTPDDAPAVLLVKHDDEAA